MDWYRTAQTQNVLEFTNFERRAVTGTSAKWVSQIGDGRASVHMYLRTAPHMQVSVVIPNRLKGEEASLEVYYEPVKDYSAFRVKGGRTTDGRTFFKEVFTIPVNAVDFKKNLAKWIPELTRNLRVILRHIPEPMPAVELRTRRKRWK